MSSPDRTPHLGPETTATFWMGRTANLIQTIQDSPMVLYVSSYVATTSVDEEYPDGVDPDTGEVIPPMERLHMILEAEQKAFTEYTQILENWFQGDAALKRAARLAEMLSEASYLSLREIDDADPDLIYAQECAYEYAKLVKTTVGMFRKTTAWTDAQESRPGDEGESPLG